MKILHTSDWHLGHRLYERDRSEEQRMALDWLLAQIAAEQIDVLVVAGDIFDLSNPPNFAREQYYNFLAQLKSTCCRHVVIVGGNHDSPSMLNAPAAVFRHFNIHIIGAASNDLEQQLLVLKNEQDEPEAVVAAVPFLRDRDLHYSQAGEKVEDREKRLQAGIKAHYERLAVLAQSYADLDIPLITTGHLYAHGATAREKKSNIYVGNRKNIKGDDFPAIFDYVALGHIHRPQRVAELEHVRYSGSLIPLDFSEVADDKLVLVLDFNVARLDKSSKVNVREIPVPTFRRLRQLTGSLEEVKDKLTKFLARRSVENPEKLETLSPWLEVRVSSDKPILQLKEQLEEIIGEQQVELLTVKLERSVAARQALDAPEPDLSDLAIEEVFARRCQGDAEALPVDYDLLLDTFKELRSWDEERQAV